MFPILFPMHNVKTKRPRILAGRGLFEKRLQMFTASLSLRPRTHGETPYAQYAMAAHEGGGFEMRHGPIVSAGFRGCQ